MPSRRPLAVALVAALSLGGAAACTRTSGGTPVALTTSTTSTAPTGPETTTTLEPPASEGKELYVYAPAEGDCIDLRARGDQGATTTRSTPGDDATPRGSNQLVLRLDCELPHQYEVISVVRAQPLGPPDDGALVAAAKQLCPPAFATYVGAPYERSALEVGWVLPAEGRREVGNIEIGCLAFDPDGKLSGSVRGSGR